MHANNNTLLYILKIVVAFGLYLSDIKSMEKMPPCLPQYLNLLLQFTVHPSLTIYGYITPIWVKLAKHPKISTSPDFTAIIPQLLERLYKQVCHALPMV